MTFFLSHLLFLFTAAFPAEQLASAAEKEPIPKVNIPDMPPSFRDVGIELRCSALSEYVARYAKDYLTELNYKEVGCSEGNGLGGATYELEFRLKNVPDVKAYSIQLSMNESTQPGTKICMQTESDTYCSLDFGSLPLATSSHFKTDSDEKTTQFINRNYIQPAKDLQQLTPAVALWVSGAQKFKRIFGVDFNTFVGTLLNRPLMLPVSVSEKTMLLKLELTPSSKNSATTGQAKLLSDLPSELQHCLGCTDNQCNQTKLKYTFNNRFLSISGLKEDRSQTTARETGKYGLAWIMEGPDPVVREQPNWRFFCGVSRYSVQVIKR